MESETAAEIESMLKALKDEGLLTDIECRMVVQFTAIEEAKNKISGILKSRNKEHADVRNNLGTQDILSPESSINPVNAGYRRENDSIATLASQRNPFLNNTVLKCLFGYLSLDDIKTSRLVCSKWNATAEIFLRKRSAIHFQPLVLQPRDFIQFSKFSLPQLPFSAFKFSGFWDACQIVDFFDQWGQHIKEIKLMNIDLANCGDSCSRILSNDITTWLTTTSSLSTLKIEDVSGNDDIALLDVSLNNFTTLTSLILKCCGILLPEEDEDQGCAPLEISLNNIQCIEDDEIVDEFCFNELVDFSKAKKIFLNNKAILNIHVLYLVPPARRTAIFDMADQVFKAEKLHLSYVHATNWENAKGDIHFLMLEGCSFVEKTQLNIEILFCANSTIDFSVVPQTVKALKVGDDTEIMYVTKANLPNLQFLSFKGSFIDLSLLTPFANCTDLVELELGGIHRDGWRTFDLRCVPKSVKRLTLNFIKFEFADDAYFLKLETLILKNELQPICLEDCKTIIQKIRSTVLIINCWKAEFSSEIIALSETNKHIKKIVICLDQSFGREFVFEGCALSRHVDKKSNYYQFQNTIGKAITREQFYQMEDTHFVLNSEIHWFEV